MKLKKLKIIILLAFFLSIIHVPLYAQNESNNEYTEREQEAINIINSINPLNENYYEEYVYIEEDSSQYHYYGCKELTKTPHKMEKSEAINRGYYACDKCNPYISSDFNSENSKNNINNNLIIVLLFIFISLLIIYIIFNEIIYKKQRKKNKIQD